MPTLLILGGTGEAVTLAAALGERHGSSLRIVLSLAGRTAQPRLAKGGTRIGGFGGVRGMTDFLRREEVRLVVDATHPFSTRISNNANQACAATGIARLLLSRPPWQSRSGDQWITVPNLEMAADKLITLNCRKALLTIGSQGLKAFISILRERSINRVSTPTRFSSYSFSCPTPSFWERDSCGKMSKASFSFEKGKRNKKQYSAHEGESGTTPQKPDSLSLTEKCSRNPICSFHLFARVMEPFPLEDVPSNCEIIVDRGPYTLAGEQVLLAETGTEILVTRNSGGNATISKLEAARLAGLPVLMIDRPSLPSGPVAYNIEQAMDWIEGQLALSFL